MKLWTSYANSEAQCAGDFGQAYHSSSAGHCYMCRESAKVSVAALGFSQLRACHINANNLLALIFVAKPDKYSRLPCF